MTQSFPKDQSTDRSRLTLREDTLVLRTRRGSGLGAFVKKLDGSSYCKKEKSWNIPLERFKQFSNSLRFKTEQWEFFPNRKSIEKASDEINKKIDQAWDRIKANPFCVSESDLKLARPDFEITLRPDLLISAKAAETHLLNQAALKFETSSNRSVLLHSWQLPKFLKYLKNKRISFGVAEACYLILSKSKSIRENNLNSSCSHLTTLQSGLLTPFICVENTQWKIKGATSLNLLNLLPELDNGHARRSLSKKLSPTQGLAVIWSALCNQQQLWIDEKCKEASLLSKNNDEYTEEEFPFRAPDIALCMSSPGNPALLLKDSQLCIPAPMQNSFLSHTSGTEILPPHTPFRIYHLDPKYLSLTVTNLPQETPKTRRYREYEEDLERRARLVEEREFFQNLTDFDVVLKNESLKEKLFPHQRVAVEWILRRHHSFIGDDMGLGKTLSVLASIDELLYRQLIRRVLVICPNSLTFNWQAEASNWIPQHSCTVLPKGKKRRETLEDFNTGELTILVINYEAVRIPEVQKSLRNHMESSQTFLCLDESQRVKNHASKTAQAVRSFAHHCCRRVLLSGTPTPNNISDIWSQMQIVDQGERFGNNFYDWLESVAELGNSFSQVAVKRFYPSQVKETRARVQELLLRRRKSDVLDLPAKMFITRELTMTGEQAARYEEIRESLKVRLLSISGKRYTRELGNIMEQYLRAVQVASNPRLIDPSWKGTPIKYRELDSLLDEIIDGQNQKVVVWTNYLGNISELLERYKKYSPAALSGQVSQSERHNTVKTFQTNPESLKLLIAVPAAAGVGLTLTAAQTAIYLDKTWNAEHWLQSIDRIHRIGQTGTVSVVTLHASKVDLMISRSLAKKCAQQSKLLDQSEYFHLPSRDELLDAVR